MARRRSGKKIDFVHWVRMAASSLAQSAGSVAVNVLAAQHLPETIMRTRGNMVCFAGTTLAPGALAEIGVGMILVPEGTGSTVLWSPLTDGDAPWFWHEAFHIGYAESVTDVISVQGAAIIRKEIDSKAMRIVKNMEVQFVVENSTVSAALAVNTTLAGRILTGT